MAGSRAPVAVMYRDPQPSRPLAVGGKYFHMSRVPKCRTLLRAQQPFRQQQDERPMVLRQQGRQERPAPASARTSTVEQPAAAPERPAAAPAAQPPAKQPWLSPKLSLLTAAMLWGSYTVSVRLLFATDNPPDATVVMAARGMLQAAAMLAIFSTLQPQQEKEQAQQQQQQQQQAGSEDAQQEQQQPSLLEQLVSLQSPPLWMAALELGLWNYTATALQTLGLELTSATRASFLIQATVMLTPLLSTLAGYRPGPRVWAGCGLALAGTLLVTADEAGAAAGGGLQAAGIHLGGDGAILASALFYSIGVVRIAGYTRTLPPSQIATSKSFVLGGLALLSLGLASGAAAAQGRELGSMWGGVATDPLSWAALLWSGLGPGALASYLHAQGQRHVEPAEAQVLFSSKPLWAAGLAWVLLGGEQLGALTWLGGATLVAASVLASTERQQGQRREVEEEEQAAAAPVLVEPRQRSRRR